MPARLRAQPARLGVRRFVPPVPPVPPITARGLVRRRGSRRHVRRIQIGRGIPGRAGLALDPLAQHGGMGFFLGRHFREGAAPLAARFLGGQSSQVAAGMRRSATLGELPEQGRAAMDKCAGYLLKYKAMLRYDQYLRRCLPIATGVIESACHRLVKDRMDITGARRGLQRAEAILKLRSLRSSGDFEAYLAFYRQQSLQRDHASKYQHFPLQVAT